MAYQGMMAEIVSVPGDKKLYWTNNNSGDYAVGQDRTFDLSQGQPAIPPGSTVWPTVAAVAGKQVDGDTSNKDKLAEARTVLLDVLEERGRQLRRDRPVDQTRNAA